MFARSETNLVYQQASVSCGYETIRITQRVQSVIRIRVHSSADVQAHADSFPLYGNVMHDLHPKAAEYHERAAQAHRTAAK